MSEEGQFTVFVRLPFPRGDFVDPPQGMHCRAEQFNVHLSFLLQQAAWLYDRQLSQVKAQLRKVNKPSLNAVSPTPGSVSGSAITGGHAMARTGSGGSRVPSSLAIRQRERPISQGEASNPGFSPSSHRARVSRSSSTSTVYQVQKGSPTITQQPLAETPSLVMPTAGRMHDGSYKAPDAAKEVISAASQIMASSSSKADESTSSSSSESETAAPLSRSRAYMRRPRPSNPKPPLGPLSDNDEQDDADSPPFLPFSDAKAAAKPSEPRSDPSATLRMAKRNIPTRTYTAPQPPLNSSSSSAHSQPPKPTRAISHNPTSPHRANMTEPASALSPRQRRVTGKDGSEGTPSMGSSFSDLDDASVTQSALEEALAHEMNQGGVASRMSTISQALRSRYL
ncbi:MAG: hypothetical protein Q9174_000762 [Haloplaca sp. 1 TL-2023]